MRSIVTLSLLSITALNTTVGLIQQQPVEPLLTTDITGSEYSILFAEEANQFNNLALDVSNISSSLESANKTEKDRYVQELEKQKEEEERLAREAEARAREEERQLQLAAEKERAAQQRREAEAAAVRERELAAQQPPAPSITGTKQDWMRAAGIPETDWVYVDFIVHKESSWNPNAVNSSSGACGLAQALPCSKIPGDWRDPVVSLAWQYSYVKSRYGGYKGAYDFWIVNNWY